MSGGQLLVLPNFQARCSVCRAAHWVSCRQG